MAAKNPTITLEVLGTAELMRKMGDSLYAAPVSRFFRAAGWAIKGRAQDKVPRYDSFLYNSIAVEYDSASPMRWVKVVTAAEHAIWVEKGTRPHFPPIAAITPWAEAKGLNPYGLAIGISRRGTKAHPFLKPALTESKGDIVVLMGRMASDIEAMGRAKL